MKRIINIISLIFVILFLVGTSSFALSGDVSLKSLKINPGKDYEKVDNTTYKITVGNNVSSLNIVAEPTNERANVTIEGNNQLEVGSNIVKVIVTAENGTKATYKIKVRKLSVPISEQVITPNVETPSKNETTSNVAKNEIVQEENIVNEVEDETNGNELNEVLEDKNDVVEIKNIDANSNDNKKIIIIVAVVIVVILIIIALSKKGKKNHRSRH